jgi:hypothetical protein
MLKVFSTIVAAAAFTLVATGARAQDTELTCEDARCMFQAEITGECACDGFRNHGQYVKCVGAAVRRLTAANPDFKNCRGKLVRCAARSICGKEGFVTCNRDVLGTCDTTTGFCIDEGFTEIACTSNEQCIVGTRCSTKRSAEQCTEHGGTVGTSPTCCSDCVVTP